MSKRLVCVLLLAVLLIAVWPGRAQAHDTRLWGKHININLSLQRLRAWDGNHVVLFTYVTTGNRLLPTPTGWYHIYAKYSPYEFISPWPTSSPFWYPPSRVNYAMEFLPGYFIHDAPWRSVFGPGSNSGIAAGTNYGGTHGCVNVPYWAERFLYYWAPIGTPVHIVP